MSLLVSCLSSAHRHRQSLSTLARRCLIHQQRCFTSAAPSEKPSLSVVDLRTAGWSLLERLCAEEFLQSLTNTNSSNASNWLIVGSHEATQHRHLQLGKTAAPEYIRKAILETDDSMGDGTYNASCVVILEVDQYKDDLNVAAVERDGVLCLQNKAPDTFVGGSVVLDHASILTTLILNNEQSATVDMMTDSLWNPTLKLLDHHRMQSANQHAVSPLTMVIDSKSCSNDNSGRILRLEDLGVERGSEEEKSTTTSSPEVPTSIHHGSLSLVLEPPNRYCLGTVPVGLAMANQNTVRSVLYWDFQDEDHESYYNNNRDGTQSFAKLQDTFLSRTSSSNPNIAMDELLLVCQDEEDGHFSVEQVLNPRDLQTLMAQHETSLQDWWKRHSQWSIVQGF